MSHHAFAIYHDTKARMLRITLNGHWDEATTAAFESEMRRWINILKVGCSANLLIDARQHGVQSQQTVRALQALAQHGAQAFRRTAVLVDSALHLLQAQRIQPTDHHRIFGNESEALAWLESG